MQYLSLYFEDDMPTDKINKIKVQLVSRGQMRGEGVGNSSTQTRAINAPDSLPALARRPHPLVSLIRSAGS